MGALGGSGQTCGSSQRYYIKGSRDPWTQKWFKAHPLIILETRH